MKSKYYKKLYEVVSDNGRVFQFEGRVHVGDKGDVFVEEGIYGKNHIKGSWRSPRTTHGGYNQIQLCDVNGNKGFFYIHRLVAYAWLPKKDWEYDVMHKDDNPLNNSVTNLAWCTHRENIQDMISKGRNKVTKNRRYPDEVLIEIYTRRKKGESVQDIHKDYPHIKKSSFMHFTSGRALRIRGLIPTK